MSVRRIAGVAGAVAASFGCLALAGAAPSQAGDRAPRTRAFGTRGVVETSGTTAKFVRIDGRGESFAFATSSPSTDLHVTFGAECTSARTRIVLTLDGRPIAPASGEGTAPCAQTGGSGAGALASGRVVVPAVGPGEHVLQVESRTDGAAAAEAGPASDRAGRAERDRGSLRADAR